jgi:hypothetical protein
MQWEGVDPPLHEREGGAAYGASGIGRETVRARGAGGGRFRSTDGVRTIVIVGGASMIGTPLSGGAHRSRAKGSYTPAPAAASHGCGCGSDVGEAGGERGLRSLFVGAELGAEVEAMAGCEVGVGVRCDLGDRSGMGGAYMRVGCERGCVRGCDAVSRRGVTRGSR